MAELIFKDTGLLIDEGDTAENYMERIEFDPEFHQIVNTGQQFNRSSTKCHLMRSPMRQVWFYFPTLNKFFLNERSEHSAIKAFKSVLGPERFTDIMDDLEETGPIHDCLHALDIPKLRRKLERLRQKGLISIQERVNLDDLVIHFTDEPPMG